VGTRLGAGSDRKRRTGVDRAVRSGGDRDLRILLAAAVAAAIFALTTAMAMGPPPAWEIRLFEAVNGLPDWLFVVVWPFMQYGVFVTIPIVAAVALALRHRLLSALLLSTGVTIYLVAKVAKQVADRGRPGAFLADMAAREHFAPGSQGFPSGHAAVAGAIAAITYFWLPRSLQRLTIALVGIVVVGRMYVGAHLPLDLVGGVAMGVAAGCLATFVFGGRGAPTPPGATDEADEAEEERTMVTTDVTARAGEHGNRRRVRPAPASSRHAGDVARVVAGASVLFVSLLAVRRAQLSVFERDLFLLVNNLPGLLHPVLVTVMQAGNVFAAPTVAVLALLTRSRRLALDAMVAGPVAWFAAKGVKSLVERPRPVGFLDDLTRMGPEGLGFVSGHTAVAAALATVAAPYLPRRARHLAWAGVWTVGFARMYVGAHLPMDIVGGAALGWIIGAGVHLLLGAPHRIPTLTDARKALERAGWVVTSVHAVPGTPAGSFPFIASGPDGERFVKLLDPETRNRDWIFRAARFFVFRDVRDEAVMGDSRAQAEHEAAMTLLAREAGCRAPAIVAIEHLDRRTWLVQEVVGHTSLSRMQRVDPSVLESVWEQVARLHRAGMAHRDLVVDNVVIDASGRPTIVDFAHAVSSASVADRDNDVAELLASTAALVGAEAAVRAATSVLGAERVHRAAADLQPLALTAATRRALHTAPGLLTELRRLVAPELTASAPTARRRAHQVRALVAGLGGTAVLVLLAGPVAVAGRFELGAWRWFGVVVLTALVLWAQGAALVVFTAGRRLALGRTMAIVAESGSAAVVAGRRPAALLANGLRRSGLVRSEARATAGLVTATRMVVAAAGLVVVAIWSVVAGEAPSLSLPWSPWWVAAVGGVCLLLVVWPLRRRPIERPDVPRRWAVLTAMAAGELIAWVLVLAAAEQAVGGQAALAAVAVAAVAGWLAGLLLRGAPGVAEVVMVLVLGASGLALPVAVAAVLVTRAATYWVPALAAPLLFTPLRRRWIL
jgi:glycosyltransferase 2 family protein